jgi:LmbE family N-acetylglucosaminyl deacetylase
MTNSLELVPEDWNCALAIVAHPDDLEYGAASAIARWARQGKTVVYCLVTSGEAGIDSMHPDEAARVRQEEQRRSAAVVGVDTVEFLAHPDGLVEASLALRRVLATVIRRHRPEVLVSINYRDHWPGAFNHADHRNVGIALIDAARDAANRWVFPGAGGPAWKGLRFAIFGGSTEPTHAVDVTATIDLGVASLREHRTYLEALGGGMSDPDSFLRDLARATGPTIGVEAAVSFEMVAL